VGLDMACRKDSACVSGGLTVGMLADGVCT